MKRAGLDIALDDIGAHSLRAGFVTESKRNGAGDASVMAQIGHRSVQTLKGYIRDIDAWERPASGKLGL